MAGIIARSHFGPVASGTSTITLLMLKAAANHRIKIRQWLLSFQGTNTTATPIECQLVRATTDGTGSAADTLLTDTTADETIQTTATDTFGGSNEPSLGAILAREYVHPQTKWHEIVPEPDKLIVPGGGRVVLRVVSPGTSVNVTGWIEWEE